MAEFLSVASSAIAEVWLQEMLFRNGADSGRSKHNVMPPLWLQFESETASQNTKVCSDADLFLLFFKNSPKFPIIDILISKLVIRSRFQ